MEKIANMFCEKCGAKINPGDKFCPSCGAKIKAKKEKVIDTNPEPNKVLSVFSKIGYPLGIASIPCALIPLFLGLAFFGVPGIIFSAVGIKKGDVEKSHTGLVCAIVGTSLNFVFTIGYFVLIALIPVLRS